MRRFRSAMIPAIVVALLVSCPAVVGQQSKKIPAGAKVFISPMDGFETYLKAAIIKKKVPVEIVEDKSKAEFEIVGAADSKKASTAKKIIMWNWHSTEEASIQVIDVKSSEVTFAYAVHKASSAHGKQSSAEACAKHLKEKIEQK